MSHALWRAAYDGNTEKVRQLLRDGKFDVHACDVLGKPDCALRAAALQGHAETVRVLLEHKANVHVGGSFLEGEQPGAALRLAVLNGSTETVQLLIKAKANVHVGGLPLDSAPDFLVRRAASKGKTEIVLRLLKSQANVDHLPISFVEKYFAMRPNDDKNANQVANLGLGLRAGVSILRAVSDRYPSLFRLPNFESVRSAYVAAMLMSICCRDLCEFVLSHV